MASMTFPSVLALAHTVNNLHLNTFITMFLSLDPQRRYLPVFFILNKIDIITQLHSFAGLNSFEDLLERKLQDGTDQKYTPSNRPRNKAKKESLPGVKPSMHSNMMVPSLPRHPLNPEEELLEFEEFERFVQAELDDGGDSFQGEKPQTTPSSHDQSSSPGSVSLSQSPSPSPARSHMHLSPSKMDSRRPSEPASWAQTALVREKSEPRDDVPPPPPPPMPDSSLFMDDEPWEDDDETNEMMSSRFSSRPASSQDEPPRSSLVANLFHPNQNKNSRSQAGRNLSDRI